MSNSNPIRDFLVFIGLALPKPPAEPPIPDTIRSLAADSYRMYLNHQAQAEYHASLSASYKRQFIRLNNDLKGVANATQAQG